MAVLAERLRIAMQGPPVRNVADVARACGIASSSVSAWLSGKTKKIEGANLLAAAEYLGVNPKWLANEEAPRDAPYVFRPRSGPGEGDGKRHGRDRHDLFSQSELELLSLISGLTHTQQEELKAELKAKVFHNDRLEHELKQRRSRSKEVATIETATAKTTRPDRAVRKRAKSKT
ncbi:helix-turn-helix domain-containing protein [Caballeronia sp. GaOx3]|uniref:helix-turn-helix domain-containing protein n=1 Tax=Caballeronia sp. GaOx3 TaxID=2921740 RepID=UPI0028AB4A39|nr:helix-turn-helix domain-containing protein [Caballeronia sp. GaOx3]